MMPVEKAAEVYQLETCKRSFREDLEAHLLNGFVFSRPDFFIMGRPVIKAASYEEITDPTFRFPSANCDTWHIHLMSGNMVKAWAIMPWELPWFAWERKNELRFYSVSAIRRLSGGAL
jgi:hypothetical protein